MKPRMMCVVLCVCVCDAPFTTQLSLTAIRMTACRWARLSQEGRTVRRLSPDLAADPLRCNCHPDDGVPMGEAQSGRKDSAAVISGPRR